jgi:hypothetical protein
MAHPMLVVKIKSKGGLSDLLDNINTLAEMAFSDNRDRTRSYPESGA